MSSFTKGPWEVSVNSHGEFDVCEAGGGDIIADLSRCKNQEANAALIKEAPAMFDALLQISQTVESPMTMVDGVLWFEDGSSLPLADLVQKATANVLEPENHGPR